MENLAGTTHRFQFFYSASQEELEACHKWIKKGLSEPMESLRGMTACPFAAQSLTQEQVSFFSCHQSPKLALKELVDHFEVLNKRVAVLIAPLQSMTLGETSRLVCELRNTHFIKNKWIMYDHPESNEVVEGIRFNYDHALLFFVQELTDICKSSDLLLNQGYYGKWPEEYFDDVVGIRKKYLNRYLSQKA